MKAVLHIAKNEVRNLFYSPIAWAVLIVMYLLSILCYFDTEGHYMTYYMRGGYDLKKLEYLTRRIIESLLKPQELGQTIVNYIYLLMPLITMGVFAREFRQGTDRLLFSSPISSSQIVMGKFLGIMIFNLLLVAAVGVVFIYFGTNILHADWQLLFMNLLSFYLLVMVFASVGMFISSLTSYQVVAGVITLVAMELLLTYLMDLVYSIVKGTNIGGENFYITFPYLRDYITLYGFNPVKLLNFQHGIFNTRDIIYFFNISGVFIAFTLMRLKSKRQKIARWRKWVYYLTVLITFSIIGVVTSKTSLTGYKDVSREKLFTITPATQKILAAFDKGPLHVTYYVNVLDHDGPYEFHRYTRVGMDKYWELYRRFKRDIDFDFVYYYNIKGAEPDLLKMYPGFTERKLAEKISGEKRIPFEMVKSPEDMAALVDLDFEQYRNVAKLSYQERTTYLRNFPFAINFSQYLPEESEVAPALCRLQGNQQPKVYFSTGNGESDINGYGTWGLKTMANDPIRKRALINVGFDFDTVNIGQKPLPDSTSPLAIWAPQFALSSKSIEQFGYYVKTGRNIFIAIAPDKRETVSPLLNYIGLKAKPGVLGRSSQSAGSSASGTQVIAILLSPAKAFNDELKKYIEKETFYLSDSLKMFFDGTFALDVESNCPFKAEPFLILDTSTLYKSICFNRPEAKLISEMEGKLTQKATDEVLPLTIGYKLTRIVAGKEQRIIVIGNAGSKKYPDMLTYLGPPIFGWLTNGQFPLNLIRPEPLDKTFNIEAGTLRTRKWIWIYGVTGLLILVASVILIRRMRK